MPLLYFGVSLVFGVGEFILPKELCGYLRRRLRSCGISELVGSKCLELDSAQVDPRSLSRDSHDPCIENIYRYSYTHIFRHIHMAAHIESTSREATHTHAHT